jgi:hypothetical protein
VARWATLAALGGGALLAYLAWAVPPRGADGAANVVALAAAFVALLALASGLGTVAALALHRRWPSLAGVERGTSRRIPRPATALRQGVLAGVAAAALAGLSALGLLDPAFAIATLLLLGLIEAFWQSQDAARK